MDMLSFTSTTTNHQVKNVSFSSYPSIDDDTFLRKLTDPTQHMNPIMSKTQQHHKEEDGELRVFGAEKYFNEENPKPHLLPQQFKKQESRTDTIQPMKPSQLNQHGSSSIQSESSWNSQSALLKKAKKSKAKSFLGSLSCKCVCSDKESVDIVEDNVVSTRYNLVPAKNVITTQDQIKPEHFEPENARKSLEVFGSSSLSIKRRENWNQDKPDWEANPRMLQDQVTEFEDKGVYESGSDASSDLFEIESLTGKVANPFITRQSYDVPNSGCVTPTTCYAPSEASIEWSVVTASAADFSALSDSEDHIHRAEVKPRKGMVQRRRPNLLLSCKSNKAVRVARDAYVVSDKVRVDGSPRTRHGYDPMIGVTRFQGFDSRQERGLVKQQISRSPRGSHLLYIQ